jgi:hypothetical protein
VNRSVAPAVAVAAVWLVFVAAVYVPDAGRGFVKDDFAWIKTGRSGLVSIVRQRTPGFYRPLVGASFAADYLVHGLRARGYGLTNLFLYVASALAIAALIRQVGLSAAAAAFGAFAWAVNPHGINMAVLWISGRTSLLLTLWSVLAAIAFVRRQRAAGAAFVLLAALSKEEAVMLPAMIGALLAACRPNERRAIAADVGAMAAAIAIYLALRMQTPAFVPATAPWFYRPVTDPLALLDNAVRYLDRGLTIALLLALAIVAACRARPQFERRDFSLAAAAVVWFALGFALTVFVPVRSSLYAVFPSVGAALGLAVVVDAIRRSSAAFDRRVLAVPLVLLLFVPVYRARNRRWVEPARTSERSLAAVMADLPRLPERGTILFEDTIAPPADFDSAFGTLGGDAVRLFTSRPLDARVVDRRDAAGLVATTDIAARYRIVGERVERVP